MAWIYDKNGQQKCEVKKLSYNGVFMDVASITVTVESAAPIDFSIGDYIEWDYDGLRYTLDTAAGVEKVARRNTIGNAFIYENLVFLSPLKAADNVDFLDVILGNTVDFLTNTEFSFYGTAWDYAKRIEANLCRLYGDDSWKVRIWTNGICYDESPATDISTGSWENKLVDVSGIKCLGGFKQIYDLWGCAYVFSVDNGVNYVDFYDDFELYAKAWKAGGVDKIFAYGKGNGLYKIRHTADADHVLVTRLRACGSSDNLPANYYLNSPDYHVDGNESSELAISHLMLPASQWTKGGVKSPANAYLEQNTELYGVREASVYWDGSDSELGEIKPTIYGLTIQELLNLMAPGDSYRPVGAKWPDTTQRIDKIITGAAPTDNGAVAEAGYDFTVVEASGSTTAHDFGVTRINHDVEFNDLLMGITPSVSHLAEFRIVPISNNKKIVSFDIPGEIASRVSAVKAYITPYVNGAKVEDATVPCAVSIETISNTVSEVLYTKRCNISLLDATENPIVFSTMLTGPVTFRIRASVVFNGEMSSGFSVIRNEYAVSFNLLRGNKAIDKFFSVTIPQVGFDLAAAVSGAAKLCMRSGYNQPREFQIVASSVRYLSASDTWYLRCKRVVDQSTQTYFPNSDAVIAAGDEYYLAGIAMPSLYVEIAANKLKTAAQAWLSKHSKPRMLSSVDVDNKIMAVEGIVLKEGMSLPLSDVDLGITPQNQESRVIDNIRIEEGTSPIRTFTITLRDKKEKSSLDAAIRGATSNFATNTSVSEAVSAVESRDHGSLSGRDMPNQHPITAITGLEEALAALTFFEKDGNGNVKLKDEYGGLWADGFMTAGGIGSGGGGGDVDLPRVWESLTNNTDFPNVTINPAHIPDMANVYGYLKGNQQITLTGVVTGSGTTSITTSIADGALTIAKTSGLQSALNAKQDYIRDLDTIRSNAASGATAYSWGNHASAGYLTSADGITISSALQSLQSQIDSVASRNEFDELAATAFHADVITTPLLYAEVVSLNGVDLNTRLVGISADIAAEALARASADTTLTGAVNDVASRATALEGRVSSLETRATALEGRADSLEDKFDANGNAKSALKLTTVSKTIWGQTYWTSGGVPQNVTAAPNLYIGATKVQTSQAAQALIGILSLSAVVSPGETDETKIEWDADAHAWHFHGGLYADSFIVAGGSGSGGGGGSTDLSDMWLSLKTNEDEFANEKIHPDHIPSLSWGKITTGKPTTLLGYGITDAYTKLEVDNLIGAINQFHYEVYPSTSSVTNPQSNVLYLIGPTGSGSDKYEEYVYPNSTTGWTKIGDTTIDLSPYLTIASAQATYQPIISDLATIRTQAAHGETAYNSLGTISDCLQSLQSQIDSVASRDGFDELTATVLFADMISTPSIYVETLSLNGNDLAGALSNLSSRATSLEGRASSLESRATSLEGRATSLEGKFTGDSANSALRLAGTSSYSIWGVEYWSSGVPKSVTGRPGLFIGSTQVQTSNSPQPLAGITTLTASGLATIAGGISLGGTFEGVDSKIVWDATNSAWHLIGNFYADGFIVAGGTGSGGGGGDVDLDRVWESLTNNTDFPNVKILGTHIPDMASTYGYLKGNQTITLTGVVTGSGATTIATSIANNALSISMVNGLQAALDSKTGNLGTVTSIGLLMPTGFSVSSSPITASGTLSVSFSSGYSLLTSTQISTWNGKQDAIGDLDTIRTNAALGAEANGWGNHASAGYFKASSFTAANIASTLGNTAVNRATADASGENISDKFGIVGVALQSLQSQIDSLASKNAFDELSVTVLNTDMVTATTAYLETIYGSLQGNALTASYLYSQSYSAGSPVNPVYFTSGRPAPCSYSFGNASGNVPINNGILNTNLWANYATCDSSNENISDKFGIVSVALQSIQSQVDSVASRDSFDELSATVLHADMLTVGAQVNVSGAIFSDEGIYTNGYLVGGGVVSSSDRRLKDEITKVDAERAWEVLMALNPVEWVWNENNAHLYGRRSAGLVAQEVFDVLPYSVFHDGQYDALRYDVFHAFEIAGLQDHEARIRALEAENKELKRQVELLTR